MRFDNISWCIYQFPCGNLIIKHKRAKGDDGYRTFSIRIKEEIVSKLDNISTQTGHSRNELIGLLLEYAIENCRVEEK